MPKQRIIAKQSAATEEQLNELVNDIKTRIKTRTVSKINFVQSADVEDGSWTTVKYEITLKLR